LPLCDVALLLLDTESRKNVTIGTV